MPELAELCEEALKNYLVGLVDGQGNSVWPDSLRRGAADNFALRIFAGETEETKDGECIFCVAEKEFPEHIPSAGIYEVPVKCVLRTPTKKLTTADKTANEPEPLANHSVAAQQLRTALMANGLELSLSAAYTQPGVGFTALGILDRLPGRDQVDEYWESNWNAKLVCCPQSFPN